MFRKPTTPIYASLPAALYLVLTIGTIGCDRPEPNGQMSVPSDMGTSIPTDLTVAEPMADGGDQVRNTDWTTERVFRALEPMCAQCHGEGQSLPFFDSLTAFEQGLVGNERWVVMGAPDQSTLLDFLVGQGDGLFDQMPPAGPSYEMLIIGDSTKPTLNDLRDWIRGLESLGEPPVRVCWPQPTAKALHRLNRLEYNHAIQSLLKTESAPADDFPSEDNSFGLDNIADSLTVSPLLIEKYDLAAASLAEEVLPNRMGEPSLLRLEGESMMAPVGRAFDNYYNLWSSGLLAGEIEIDEPGEYTLRVRVGGTQAGPEPVRFEVTVNGNALGSFETAAQAPAFEIQDLGLVELNTEVSFVGIRFLNDYYCPDDRFAAGTCPDPGDRNMHIDYIELEGPVAVDVPKTPFERAFLNDCDLALGHDSIQCGQTAIRRVARLIWRRDLTESEMEKLWTLISAELDEPGGLQMGMRQGIHALLLSPNFLFRVEADSEPGERLSPYELAARLAAFIWRSVPDEALLDAASAGRLDTDDGLANIAADMLADQRGNSMIFDLGEQWLLTRQAALVDPEYELFPEFDEDLRQAMLEETRLVFHEIWRGQHSLLDLIDADFTFLNQRLASHYGLEGIEGEEFVEVQLPQANRLGLLTHASWLAATSQRTRTSPVKRGKWVLEELLCSAPPPPPPSVEGLIEDVDQNAPLRTRLEQHRADPACAACHQHMDAVGFGLEQFDAVGAFRTEDQGVSIDPAGLLLGEDTFETAVEMAQSIRARPELGPCMLNKVITYALGRGLADEESCLFDEVEAQVTEMDYRPDAIVDAIVTSPLFTIKGVSQMDSNEGGQ
ncbi:MAG: DUF1592 domain-containing protein [Myxococcota bacterium]|nr:DUF1592 domain-containing protein [Myxococcota bacterium]